MSADNDTAFDELTARDVMQTNVLTVSRSAPLSEIERVLGESRLGGVPVTDEAGHIVGMISMRDILERYTQDPDSRPRRGAGTYHLDTKGMADEDLDSYEVPKESEESVAELMSSDLQFVTTHTPLPDVAAKMLELKIHRVLVRDEQKYVGLINTFDLLGAMTPAPRRS